MLDIHFIRENPDVIRKDLLRRGQDERVKDFELLLSLDDRYRKAKLETDNLKHKRNDLSLQVLKLKKENKDASAVIKEAKELPAKIKQLDSEADDLFAKIRAIQMRIPNVLDKSVPVGKDDTENEVVRTVGKPVKKKFELVAHGELAENLDIADFKRGAKVSGAGFFYEKGALALLDNALQRFAIDILVKKGYTLVIPPYMMNRKAYEGVTDLADFENVMYKVENDDLYLIATSEHPIGAMLMDETLEAKDLPLRFIGLSPCFRREIGSRGVDTKGLFRMHQFHKIEQFVFCLPDKSGKIHEEMLKNAEELFKKLKIPYRVVNICTGDIGTVAAKKYDIEAWMPRENAYREVVSCSNCTSYQAVRLNIRYTDGRERGFVHTLNSTAIATSRAMKAILENYQNKDGSVTIPLALQPYMNKLKKIDANPK